MEDIHNINLLQKLASTYQVVLSRLSDNDFLWVLNGNRKWEAFRKILKKIFFDRFHKKDHMDAFIGLLGIKANVHILKIMV
jgi:hypothetical protein